MPVNRCLFCNGDGPFSTVEHIIPESLGNNDLVLTGEVCDGCQRYFGKEIENYVLSKTPIGVWRTLLNIQTKKGNLPSVNLSSPLQQKGTLPELSPYHDNDIGFTSHNDGTVSIDINDPDMVHRILTGERNHVQFVLSPKHLVQMGRFLGKIGLELLCSADPQMSRSDRYSDLRSYVRQGIKRDIWPLFHSTLGRLTDLSKLLYDSNGYQEEVFCYQYKLLSVQDKYDLLAFQVGIDLWIICLNDPYPTPIIREALPESNLKLIWYSLEEWKRNSGGLKQK